MWRKFHVSKCCIPLVAAMAICDASRGSVAGISWSDIRAIARSSACGVKSKTAIPRTSSRRSLAAPESPERHSSRTICETSKSYSCRLLHHVGEAIWRAATIMSDCCLAAIVKSPSSQLRLSVLPYFFSVRSVPITGLPQVTHRVQENRGRQLRLQAGCMRFAPWPPKRSIPRSNPVPGRTTANMGHLAPTSRQSQS